MCYNFKLYRNISDLHTMKHADQTMHRKPGVFPAHGCSSHVVCQTSRVELSIKIQASWESSASRRDNFIQLSKLRKAIRKRKLRPHLWSTSNLVTCCLLHWSHMATVTIKPLDVPDEIKSALTLRTQHQTRIKGFIMLQQNTPMCFITVSFHQHVEWTARCLLQHLGVWKCNSIII